MAELDTWWDVARVLDHAACHRIALVIARTPHELARASLYQALDEHIASNAPRRESKKFALIDLSNHPMLPAQTIVGSRVRYWNDLAEGLPDALANTGVVILLGLEQMLADMPNRLAAFLEARARQQVVVVLTPLAEQVRSLPLRGTRVMLDESLAHQRDLQAVARSVAHAAIAVARRTARHTALNGIRRAK